MTRVTTLAIGGVILAAAGCAEPAAPPEAAPMQTMSRTSSLQADAEPVQYSQLLADINAQIAPSGIEIGKAELIVDTDGWQEATIIIANNRTHGISAEFVNRDPRRGGHPGLTYVVNTAAHSQPVTRDPDGSNLRFVSYGQLVDQIEEGVAAWRDRTCADAPIARVDIPAGTDPDQLDEFFNGLPVNANYAPVADIVESGWMPQAWFRAVGGGPRGNNIIGVTFTFHYINPDGSPTDIDNNGKADAAFAEVYYNTRFAWGTTQALNVVDFYSIITHETGHAVGLGHFGKVFVTEHDLTPTGGIPLSAIKYAPKAIMNAVYVTGRGEITGTDNSSFCQIWSSKN